MSEKLKIEIFDRPKKSEWSVHRIETFVTREWIIDGAPRINDDRRRDGWMAADDIQLKDEVVIAVDDWDV